MKKLIVNATTQRASLFAGNQLIKIYTISTAENGLGCQVGSYCTPTGKLSVAQKIGDGEPLGRVFRGRKPTSDVWSSDPNNPLHALAEDLVLTRILWLKGEDELNRNTFDRFIYLHGTNQESHLGKNVSHGCIRFSNADIIDIYEQMSVGDLVEVA